jgi:hypothetical protein
VALLRRIGCNGHLVKKIRHYPTCSYCGEFMEILTKAFKVRFKTLKVPPVGAKELNIFKVIPKIFFKKFFICGRCGAKYDFDYDHNLVPHLQKALIDIPSSTLLLNDFIFKELSKYPPNTTCELIWRKSFHKKVLKQRSNYTLLTSFNKLINLFCW